MTIPHNEDRDYAHEADMAALRREQLEADFDLDDEYCDRCEKTLRDCECCFCAGCVRRQLCRADNTFFEGPDVFGFDDRHVDDHHLNDLDGDFDYEMEDYHSEDPEADREEWRKSRGAD